MAPNMHLVYNELSAILEANKLCNCNFELLRRKLILPEKLQSHFVKVKVESREMKVFFSQIYLHISELSLANSHCQSASPSL